MSITSQEEFNGIQIISHMVAETLAAMRTYARPGMSTQELDEYGGALLNKMGAKSAPKLTYGFPGWTCISVNHEIAHGIPKATTILKEGDLINVDVSAEYNGYWADNGSSFVIGQDINQHQQLVDASKEILLKAIQQAKAGTRIAEIGRLIEQEAKKKGYNTIKNLTGHGVGRSLHEAPHEIANYYDRFNREKFKKNSVVAIETFISTKAAIAYTMKDGWTLQSKDNSFVAQHEHTLMITEREPFIFTSRNGI